MNISTGGPHILLFERDQQLATLLTSELQLAGYNCHTARTAVEVFDAIARFPIRMVLVNLAQAAAARREFWVALDAQRRDRKVQVMTFLCTNLAGYGPREFEDRPQNTMADQEIDGMLGLMNLVEVVRTHVPNNATETTNTLPRMLRSGNTNSSSTDSIPTLHQMPSSGGNEPSHRTVLSSDTGAHPTMFKTNSTPVSPTSFTNSASSLQSATSHTVNPQTSAQSPVTGTHSLEQQSYSEKIRAILQPEQRSSSAQGTTHANSTLQEHKVTNTLQQMSAPTTPSTSQSPGAISAPLNSPSDSALQRLANGFTNNNSQGESGLAQLSRMLQDFRSTSREEPQKYSPGASSDTTASTPTRSSHVNSSYTPLETSPQAPSSPMPQPQYKAAPTAQPEEKRTWVRPQAVRPSQADAPTPTSDYKQAAGQYTVQVSVTPSSPEASRNAETTKTQKTQEFAQPEQNTPFKVHIAPTQRTQPENESLTAPPLRASPIQDIPIERTASNPALTDTTKRPDVLSRANYGQQQTQQSSPAQTISSAASPLASISTPTPAVTPRTPSTSSITVDLQQVEEKLKTPPTMPKLASTPFPRAKELNSLNNIQAPPKQAQQEMPTDEDVPETPGEGLSAKQAALLDIVQSLPPMPELSPHARQSIQPQVLNGRATRSLNKVLLDGHLVPQDRLDVAQNIQRMLRGVDLNYQLGEILLMFKLLTPDQLLAANLVSFDLITTTQISALGRIRQELHAMGLEYDLENLLVLFRILTPEQLREVRSSMQN